MSLKALFKMFPDDATAEAWFVTTRWPNGIACHYCGSTNVQTGCQHKSMPFRCREKQCPKRFSVRTGTVMQSSKLGLPDVGHRRLPAGHEPQGHLQHGSCTGSWTSRRRARGILRTGSARCSRRPTLRRWPALSKPMRRSWEARRRTCTLASASA